MKNPLDAIVTMQFIVEQGLFGAEKEIGYLNLFTPSIFNAII